VDVIAKFGTLISLFEKAICHVTIIASGARASSSS
jgi:hypothetical protein